MHTILQLKCSRDPTGCGRCRRRNLHCEYVNQRRGKRPRLQAQDGIDDQDVPNVGTSAHQSRSAPATPQVLPDVSHVRKPSPPVQDVIMAATPTRSASSAAQQNEPLNQQASPILERNQIPYNPSSQTTGQQDFITKANSSEPVTSDTMGSIYDYSTGGYLSTSGDDFAQLLARFEVDHLDRSLINAAPLTGTYYPFIVLSFLNSQWDSIT